MANSGYDIGDQPITGFHLIQLQQWAGLDVSEMVAALGISYPRWFQLTREDPHEPVTDPDLALMIWAAFTFPVETGFVRTPTAETVYEKYEEVANKLENTRGARAIPKNLVTYRMFAMLQGRDGANGYRWLSDPDTKPISMHLRTRRLMAAFYNILSNHGVKGLRLWLKRVKLEVKQRQVDRFWERGSWRQPKTKKE